MACGGINDYFWDQQRKVIFGASPIQVTEVLTDPHLPIFLLHRDNIGEPSWILGLLKETCNNKFIDLRDDIVF